MKFKTTLALGLSALGFVSGLRADDATVAAPAAVEAPSPMMAPAAPAPKYGDDEVLQALGWLAGRQMNLDTFNFTPEQMDKVVAGIRLAASNQELPFDKEVISPMIQQYVQAKQLEFMSRLKIQNETEGAAYFVELAKNPAVTLLPSGLGYEIVKEGTGAKPTATDVVKVHYTGKLLDGSVFDSSEGKEPVEFPVNQVIAGWTEGIQQVAVGGKIRLHIPAKLGYGDQGAGRIPPGATLVFDVELLDAQAPAPAPVAAPEAPSEPMVEEPAAPAAQ